MRKLITITLVMTMVISGTPQNVFAQSSTTKEESKVIKTNNTEEDVIQKTSKSNTKTSRFPEKWKGLEYALFTSSTQDLTFYMYQTYIKGDVHTNGNFFYQGTTLQVDGTVEAGQKFVTNMTSEEEDLKIGKKVENAEQIGMADVLAEVSAYAEENGTTYEKTDKLFSSSSITIDKPIMINGSVDFNATKFLGQGIVYAKDSITYNLEQSGTPDGSRIFLCSENGDITLNGSELSMNATLYAPNGTVMINANNFTLNGRIIAKKICINGKTLKSWQESTI